MIKIAVVGPESSGKSTLCEMLADYFKVPFIPEFSRKYLHKLSKPYTQVDLSEIAKGQQKLIDSAEYEGHRYLISDTESLVVKVWSQVKYGECAEEIDDLFSNQTFDLYLLCKPDIEWKADPLREVPDYSMRQHIFRLFQQELESKAFPFVVISGKRGERMQTAIQAMAGLSK